MADSLLDDLESVGEGDQFHKADRAARVALIRKWRNGSAPTEGARGDGGQARVNPEHAQQVRENAQKTEYQGDPADFSSIKAAAPADVPPPRPELSETEIARASFMGAAIELAVAPIYAADPRNPEDLAKLPPVAV